MAGAAGLVLAGFRASWPGGNRITSYEESIDRNLDFGLEPDFSYEVPVYGPNIVVDPAGYETESAKVAILSGEQEAETFIVLDQKTGETVYSGPIQCKAGGERFAVFTDLETPGTYRIESGILGQSYDFAIDEELYDAQLKEAMETLDAIEASGQERQPADKGATVSGKCYTMVKLLLAWELYPEAFASETQNTQLFGILRAEAEWLLTMQDAEKGSLNETGDELLFCGTMAKFGYAYRNVDNAFATQCLKAADRAWRYATANQSGSGSDELLFAAAEMLRATGTNTYRTAIEGYARGGIPEASSMSEAAFYGEVTYLSTKKGVNKTICALMMENISGMAEYISLSSREDSWLVEGESVEEILRNMEIQSVVNYVITNHEYETVIENHLHYLAGRNEQRKDLRPDLYGEPKSLASYIFLLSAVVN